MSGIDIRPMEDGDVDGVVALLAKALGPAPGGVDRRELFVWKHLANPFGRSIALVAETDGEIVGLRAFMRWRLATREGEVQAVRAVDTATSPAMQRRGVFSALTREGLWECRRRRIALVFNTPNSKSLPGYLKLGWRPVARWPVRVWPRRRLEIARAALRRDLGAGPGVEVPAEAGGDARTFLEQRAAWVEELLGRAMAGTAALHTPRTMAYLRWRYTGGPIRYVVAAEGRALVVARIRRRGPLTEAVICESLASPGGQRDLWGLLRGLPASVGADHGVVLGGTAWHGEQVARRAGYRRIPRAGMTFVVRPVQERRNAAGPDPLSPGSWALTLGDLEVF
jgi:predicted N-acetyltransferase YhbS